MANVLIVLFFLSQSVPALMAGGGAGKPADAPSPEEQAAVAYEDGHKLVRAKQFPEAVILAEKCLSLDPKKAECHLIAASAYARLSQLEKAAQHYRDFLKLAPNHEAAPRVTKLLEDFDNNKAPLAPGKAEAASRVAADALKLYRAKQFSQAIRMAERCLVLDPSVVDCHKIAGAANAHLQEFDRAALHYREFVKLAPAHRDAAKIKETLERYERQKSQ